jgi:hypothetical protein
MMYQLIVLVCILLTKTEVPEYLLSCSSVFVVEGFAHQYVRDTGVWLRLDGDLDLTGYWTWTGDWIWP